MQGENVDTTPIKQEDFEKVLRMHLPAAWGAMAKYPKAPQRYLYVDLHAGCGWNEKARCDGSPLIFARVAQADGRPAVAYLYEKSKEAAGELADRLAPFQSDILRLHVVHGDHTARACALVSSLPRMTFGLIYSDPNGMDTPFDLLNMVADRCPKLDFLASINATARKRAIGAFGADYADTLSECIDRIPKRHCLIRHAVGRYQWTMAYFSDWSPKAPPDGFYDTKSAQGRAILDCLSFSQRQRKEMEIPDAPIPPRTFQPRLAL